MFLEQNGLDEENALETSPIAGLFNGADKVKKFETSFEGVYLFAGTDFTKQVGYVVAQALKIEGLLMEDANENIKMIKVVSDMILNDRHLSNALKLSVEKFGK